VAAYKGRTEVLRLLLENGVKPTGDNADALVFASMHCNDDAAALLVQGGADLDHKSDDGSTALIVAARNGCGNIVHLLLERGADDRPANRAGRTALAYALEEGEAGRALADQLAAPAIRRFVARWFAWMEQAADEELFLSSLAPGDFQARLPDARLRSSGDFRKWYRALRDGPATAGHVLTDIVVTPLAGGYAADFSGTWRASPDTEEEKRIHHWEMVLGQDGQVYLRRMVVARAAPDAASPSPAAAAAVPDAKAFAADAAVVPSEPARPAE
jgi:hypothetical protein